MMHPGYDQNYKPEKSVRDILNKLCEVDRFVRGIELPEEHASVKQQLHDAWLLLVQHQEHIILQNKGLKYSDYPEIEVGDLEVVAYKIGECDDVFNLKQLSPTQKQLQNLIHFVYEQISHEMQTIQFKESN